MKTFITFILSDMMIQRIGETECDPAVLITEHSVSTHESQTHRITRLWRDDISYKTSDTK